MPEALPAVVSLALAAGGGSPSRRAGAKPPGGRDARLDDGDLRRQDRNPDGEPDDGDHGGAGRAPHPGGRRRPLRRRQLHGPARRPQPARRPPPDAPAGRPPPSATTRASGPRSTGCTCSGTPPRRRCSWPPARPGSIRPSSRGRGPGAGRSRSSDPPHDGDLPPHARIGGHRCDGAPVLLAKGAPGVILELANRLHTVDGPVPLSDSDPRAPARAEPRHGRRRPAGARGGLAAGRRDRDRRGRGPRVPRLRGTGRPGAARRQGRHRDLPGSRHPHRDADRRPAAHRGDGRAPARPRPGGDPQPGESRGQARPGHGAAGPGRDRRDDGRRGERRARAGPRRHRRGHGAPRDGRGAGVRGPGADRRQLRHDRQGGARRGGTSAPT